MISCSESAKLFESYLDKQMTKEDLAHLETHIHKCKKCFGHLEFDRALKKLLRRTMIKECLSDSMKTLICQKLKEESMKEES